ncbi:MULTISPECIES: cyclic nucleotide-binding domain-containing protein [unclassified Streptomyces]|uniref:Crp/Fnr family transcriptional regulator n=1 Tax=Streptomyces TaxID=1883 RepID=UPI00082381E1|nr:MULTISPECIES: cyclic nucleotide-binding domain-containing protein [unclassified Streptomyces]AWN30546.1 cyclic nucleotide-binding domain-containing protein [Streptomyces sp. NEAU-S7GS2]MYT16751.1 cyclic nucleotide-binding domain-containing protein [Streptomyces sp. SID4951]SCK34908.1 Cyclic nucleotide-binding domain-containing protein [Streptomyces sp. SceaMP-e96]
MTTKPLLSVLPADGRERLMQFAHEVSFPAGDRIFEERGLADRFWIIRTGSVNLDVQVAGGRPAVVDMLGHGDLVGWSWLVPPYTWRMGAEASTPVRAYEFDATAVRALCEVDPALGLAVTRRVLDVVARRLQATRLRLVDMCGPGASAMPAPP